MPMRELSVVEQREAFVSLATTIGANRSGLCRDFGISRKTGYKWLGRHRLVGDIGLVDRSRRPHTSPLRTDEATAAAVLGIRAASNNAWGARKIAWTLASQGWHPVPALSTITEMLRRHGKLDRPAQHPGPHIRFERAEPNELWQMDFKGHFPLAVGRCHPLTVLDDHSRYSLGLEACDNEQDATVRERLTTLFRRYGLPFAMLMDNGSPWGDRDGQPFTAFTVWLMRHGIGVSHGRAYHPQTQGKEERFHRSLKAEVLDRNSFADLVACQLAFDRWRRIYNRASEHPSVYVIEEKRFCCSSFDPVGYFGLLRARSARNCAEDVARAARAKIHGPSSKGWMASIAPASAASRSVFGAIFRILAALLRLSHGSIPFSAALNTGIR